MNKYIRSLLDRHYITPSTNLDQYFFRNVHLLNKIVEYAGVGRDTTVLEIGAGLGFLTKQLAKKAKLVTAVEKDRRFEDVLREELSGYDNVELVFGNALELRNVKVDCVVGNLPYNLCEPLLKILPGWEFKTAVLLVSKKFALKLVANRELKKLVKKYGVELLDDVSKKNFFPQPKVESKIVRLIAL